MAPPTILFTAEAAAEQDEAFVHSIGLNGLLELIAIDPSLASYERSLFAESSLRYSRRMQTAEANQKLDRTMEGLLGVLSRHFLSHAAQKALEFLLRHYRIHRHNSAALLRCILPYHGTRLFVRVAALLRGGDERSGWLRAAGGERISVPPPRSLLVQRAAKESPLLDQLLSLGSAHAVAASFSAVTLLEMAGEASFSGGDAPLLRALLEYARLGLTADATTERRLGGMLLLVQLCCRHSVAREPVHLLAELVGARLRQAESVAEARDCLQCLLVLHRLPPLAAGAGGPAQWPALFSVETGVGPDPSQPATRAMLSAVGELCTQYDASALLRPLLLQLAAAGLAAPESAAAAVLALPVRSLARQIAALLAALEAGQASDPAAIWLWESICGGGARDAAAASGAPGGNELSAVERLRALQRADEQGAPMPKEDLLRRLGDSPVVAAGAVALRTLREELSTVELHRALLQQFRRKRAGAGSDNLTRAVLDALAEAGAARLAILPCCMALRGGKAEPPTVRACLAEYFGSQLESGAVGAWAELPLLCALLMQETSEPLPLLSNLAAAVEAGGAALTPVGRKGAEPPVGVASLDLCCDAALHLCRRLRTAEDLAAGSAIKSTLERLAVGVLALLPAASLLTSGLAVSVSRKAFMLLCSCAGCGCNAAGLRTLFSQHWKADRLLLLLATCWASPERSSQPGTEHSPSHGPRPPAGTRQWRATRLQALQLTRVALVAHAKRATPDNAPQTRRTAQRLLPLLLTVTHGTDLLLATAASAALAALRDAVAAARAVEGVAPANGTPGGAALPAAAGLQSEELPLTSLGEETVHSALRWSTNDAGTEWHGVRTPLLAFLGRQYGAMLAPARADPGQENEAPAYVRHCVAAPGLALIRSLLLGGTLRRADHEVPADSAGETAESPGDVLRAMRPLLLSLLQLLRASGRMAGLAELDDDQQPDGTVLAEATATAIELLQAYSADAVCALSPAEQVTSLATLLAAVSLPWGREMPLVTAAVPIAALRALTPQLFEALAEPEREQLLATLCESRRHAVSLLPPPVAVMAQGRAAPDNAGRAALKAVMAATSLIEIELQRTLALLPIDAHMVVRRLSACVSTLGVAAGGAAAADAAIGDAIATLEMLGRLRSAPEPREALVQPLFDLLDVVPDSAEYCAQLVLTALANLVHAAVRQDRSATGAAGAASGLGAAVVRRFSTRLLFELAVDPDRPQVARHALDVVTAAVPILPLDVISGVIPHLAVVSQRSLRHGQLGAALPAVERALRVLVPLLVGRGLQLRPLLRGWVRMVLSAPPALWASLLGAIVGEDASDEHLHCALSSLLAAHVARGEPAAEATSRDEDLLRLAHSLCTATPQHVQMRACSLLVLCAPMLLAPPAATSPAAAATAPSAEARALTVAALSFVREHLERHAQRAKRTGGPPPASDTPEVLEAARRLFSALVSAFEQSKRGPTGGTALTAAEASAWSALRRQAQESLLALNQLMPASFLEPLAQLLAHSEPAMQNLAVVLLQARLQRNAAGLRVEMLKHDMARMVSITSSLVSSAEAPSSQRAALLALDLLARECGDAMPQLFESAMPAVIRHVAEPHPLVLNSALLAASALVSSLGVRLVPHMPVFMPPLLRRLEAALAPAEPPREALLVAAAWLDGCGAALLSTLPLFLHPYLPRLLRSLLRLAELDTPAARAVALDAKAHAVGRTLAKAIPSRQLLPAMIDAIGYAAQAGAPVHVELLQLVQTHVMLRPPTEARSHHVLVFQVCLAPPGAMAARTFRSRC